MNGRINLMLILRDVTFHACMMLALLFWAVMWVVFPPGERAFVWAGSQPLEFLLLLIVYPVLEELCFRGFLQGMLMKRFSAVHWGISNANLMTSLIFVLFHLFSHSMMWSLAVMIPSLIYGHFRDKYQSVVPAIVLHVFYNAGYYLVYPPGF